MTKVLVTGASGHLGRPVVDELARRGCEVTAVVRAPIELPGCRQVIDELARMDTAAAEAGVADAIIHLACARTNAREVVLAEDIAGTARLIEAWRRGNFAFASSQTVYGIPRGPLTEGSPLDPDGWYDLGKICNELQLAMAPRHDGRGAALSLRLAVLFGPRGGGRGAPQFLEPVFAALAAGHTFVFGSDDALDTYGTSFLGDLDAARAFADGLRAGESGTYNVAGPFCTWRELLIALGKASGLVPKMRVRPGARAEAGEFRLPQSRSQIDGRRYADVAGFTPRQPLAEVVERFVRSLSS